MTTGSPRMMRRSGVKKLDSYDESFTRVAIVLVSFDLHQPLLSGSAQGHHHWVLEVQASSTTETHASHRVGGGEVQHQSKERARD